MPENIQNSILHLHLDEELQKYNLEGKWDDDKGDAQRDKGDIWEWKTI